MTKCNSFDKCSAPICPLLDNTGMIWFPDEDICTMHSKSWIKRQRKIQNKTKNLDTCYTLEMLNKSITIGRAIKGIDPDKDQNEEEQKWLSKHPVKKEMSEERKQELKERMTKMKLKNAV